MKNASQASKLTPKSNQCNPTGADTFTDSVNNSAKAWLKPPSMQRNMSLSLKSSGKSVSAFSASVVDPRIELASGLYDLDNDAVPYKRTAVGTESSDEIKYDWQSVEDRTSAFFEKEGVKCVMLRDYLKALAVHTE